MKEKIEEALSQGKNLFFVGYTPRDTVPFDQKKIEEIVAYDEFFERQKEIEVGGKIYYHNGDFARVLKFFSKGDLGENLVLLNKIISGALVEWTGKGWVYTTCEIATLHCCMGGYLQRINEKVF